MLNYLIKLVVLILFFSCSSTTQVSLGPSEDNVYISNGVEQYYLPLLPHWANFSSFAGCFRTRPVRYIDFEKTSKSYNLNYYQLVNLQHMINRKLYSYKNAHGQDQLSPKDESFIFQNSYQRINGGSSDFIMPQYKKVSLIWLDSFGKNYKKLKTVLKRNDVQQGYPVVVSACLSNYEILDILKRLNLDSEGVKIISSEMHVTYNNELKRIAGFELDLVSFFKGKELRVFQFGDRALKGATGISITKLK